MGPKRNIQYTRTKGVMGDCGALDNAGFKLRVSTRIDTESYPDESREISDFQAGGHYSVTSF
jgi:hypothetical protein